MLAGYRPLQPSVPAVHDAAESPGENVENLVFVNVPMQRLGVAVWSAVIQYRNPVTALGFRYANRDLSIKKP